MITLVFNNLTFDDDTDALNALIVRLSLTQLRTLQEAYAHFQKVTAAHKHWLLSACETRLPPKVMKLVDAFDLDEETKSSHKTYPADFYEEERGTLCRQRLLPRRIPCECMEPNFVHGGDTHRVTVRCLRGKRSLYLSYRENNGGAAVTVAIAYRRLAELIALAETKQTQGRKA